MLRGYQADSAVIMEPTELRIARAGRRMNFRVTVPGLSARVREEGVSAIEKFFPVYAALMALERERNAGASGGLYARYTSPYAICIGTVRAGTWASSVAESLECEGRYGIAIGEDIPAAQRQLEQAVAAAAQADPWRAIPAGGVVGRPLEPAAISPDHPIAGSRGPLPTRAAHRSKA